MRPEPYYVMANHSAAKHEIRFNGPNTERGGWEIDSLVTAASVPMFDADSWSANDSRRRAEHIADTYNRIYRATGNRNHEGTEV